MSSQINRHPVRNLAGLLVLAFCFFMLSASGQPGTFWSNGPTWLGSTGWICFLLTALTFILYAVYSLVRVLVRLARGSRHAAG